jgi:hypothetical protein
MNHHENRENHEYDNYSTKDLQKMIFIYNALDDGWTIRKTSPNQYELIKENEEPQQIVLGDCMMRYIREESKESKKEV